MTGYREEGVRQRTTWKITIEMESQKVGISLKKAKGLALDRTKWKGCTKAPCSA
jgi:hypothetical protein